MLTHKQNKISQIKGQKSKKIKYISNLDLNTLSTIT